MGLRIDERRAMWRVEPSRPSAAGGPAAPADVQERDRHGAAESGLTVTEIAPKILVVDSDAPTRSLLAGALEQAGMEPIVVADGESARRMLHVHSIDVVLLDSDLPDISGREVLRLLRQDERTVLLPVVMLTSEDELADRVSGFEAGANDYLVKPVDPVELVARIRSQIRVQDLWGKSAIDTVKRHMKVLRELGQLRTRDTPDNLAAAICERLRDEFEDVEGAALFRLVGEHGAVLLAGYGPPVAGLGVGQPIPEDYASWLRRVIKGGPALAQEGRPSALGRPSANPGAVLAPVGGFDHPFGVIELVLRMSSAVSGYQALSTAIDVAGISSLLLSPTLEREAVMDEGRLAMQKVLDGKTYWTVFQPIVDIAERRTVGFEALTRFSDGVPPDRRLAEATAVGMRCDLEAAMALTAIESASALPPGTWLAVNASPEFALSGDTLAGIVSASPVPIIVELTEHAVVDDYDALRRALGHLPVGTRVAVDDAGAGYASLSHVLQLRPTFVKLDRAWVAGIERDFARQALVGALASFAEGIGCELVAEGIETDEELETLGELSVRFGQGFLLGRPAPIRVSR
jgi:EAL domain-containing protein (putative c-di-GMP-specific phosphodiesterase class I)/DNA-binding NarL/FixJ family response regulator